MVRARKIQEVSKREEYSVIEWLCHRDGKRSTATKLKREKNCIRLNGAYVLFEHDWTINCLTETHSIRNE